MSADKLDLALLNSLPQPLTGCVYGGGEWPVLSIDVQSCMVRIDVVGQVDVCRFSDFRRIKDADGNLHDIEKFYLEEQA